MSAAAPPWTGGAEGAAAPRKLATFSKPERVLLVVGWLLSLTAGFVNVMAFVQLGSFVTHITGLWATVGISMRELASGTDSREKLRTCLGVVLSFSAGAAITGFLAGREEGVSTVKLERRMYGGVLLLNGALLVVVMLAQEESWAKFLAAVVCGLQNGMCKMHCGAIVRTAQMTGLASDFGTALGRLLFLLQQRLLGHEPDAIDLAEAHTMKQKVVIYFTIASGFIFGVFLGGYLIEWLGEFAFLVPACISALLGVAYLIFQRPLREHGRGLQRRGNADPLLRDTQAVVNRAKSILQSAVMQSDAQKKPMLEVLHLVETQILARYSLAETPA